MSFEKPKIKAPIKLGEELGRGNEKIVYLDAENPDRVVAVNKFTHRSPESIKGRFYLMNILHLLYPDIFRHIELSGVGTKDTLPYLVSENIKLSRDHKRVMELDRDPMVATSEAMQISKKILHDPQYMRVLDILGELGFDWRNPFIDVASINFSKDKDGNLQYVDTFFPFEDFSAKFTFKESDMRSQILQRLTGKDQQTALTYLERIKQLQKKLSDQREQEYQDFIKET